MKKMFTKIVTCTQFKETEMDPRYKCQLQYRIVDSADKIRKYTLFLSFFCFFIFQYNIFSRQESLHFVVGKIRISTHFSRKNLPRDIPDQNKKTDLLAS